MGFREVSDGEWEVIRPFLPPRSRVGRPRTDDRMVLNGILYVLTTGCRWMDIPLEYGSYKTAWRRLKKWQDEGVWDRVFKALASIREHGMVAVDSSTVEAKKGELVGYDGVKHRKGAKIHVCVDRDSMPLNIVIGPGNEHDSRRLLELVGGLDLEAWAALRRRSIRYGTYKEWFRIHWYRA
jgi:transposase